MNYSKIKAQFENLKVRHAHLRAGFEQAEARRGLLASECRELQRARRDLESALDRYAGLYDSAPTAILRLDRQGTILEANLSGCALLDCERSHLIGKNLTVFVSTDQRPRLREHFFRCRTSREPVSVEFWLGQPREKSRQRYVQMASAPTRLGLGGNLMLDSSIIDLTERRMVEAMLVERESEFRLLFDTLPLPAWISDRVDYTFRAVNRATIDVLGYSRREFAALTIKDIRVTFPGVHATDDARKGRWDPAALAANAQAVDANFGVWPYRRKDGKILDLEFARSPVRFQGHQSWLVLARVIHNDGPSTPAGTGASPAGPGEADIARRILEAQESERRHVARELHDELGQLLTALRMTLTLEPGADPEKIRDGLGQADLLIQDLADRVRDLSLNLRPGLLDDLGLVPALLGHVDRYTAQTGVRVQFKYSGIEGRRFGSRVETAAFRIIQEGLTNVARHAQVSEATVRVWVDPERVHVQVEDAGAGFDPAVAFAEPRSLGLLGARERARLEGGDLMIESTPGQGTRLTADLLLGDTGRIES